MQLSELLEYEHYESDVTIGIIDGGISPKNEYVAPYIVDSRCYVAEEYQNHNHATFIASTIQYGDKLNNLPIHTPVKFKFVDIIAVPNGDIDYGLTDSISEEELMEIIEATMDEFSTRTKIWNLSLGIPNKICSGTMSDLGMFLDYIQDKYKVQFFISSGNISNHDLLRGWPITKDLGDNDRLISPAESVRAITVGSVALYDSDISMVKKDEPSSFSRRGPGANYIVKPEVVDYGGNISNNFSILNLGIKGLDSHGKVVEGIGTSYSTPRVVQKFAAVYDEMVEKDILLAKAMIIHSARMNSRGLLDKNSENIKYYGFGIPSTNLNDILQCSNNEVTLVFKQKITVGTHLEMYDFPFPKSLIKNGKCHGEIGMTLAYNPILDKKYGGEYCRANIDVSFGMYHYDNQGKTQFKGCVPLESTWEEKYESARVEHGFKWSPIKSYYRKISKQGIGAKEGWKIRVDMSPRNGSTILSQEFVLIITIKDPNGEDIYTDVVNELRDKGYITTNLETRQQVRQRN